MPLPLSIQASLLTKLGGFLSLSIFLSPAFPRFINAFLSSSSSLPSLFSPPPPPLFSSLLSLSPPLSHIVAYKFHLMAVLQQYMKLEIVTSGTLCLDLCFAVPVFFSNWSRPVSISLISAQCLWLKPLSEDKAIGWRGKTEQSFPCAQKPASPWMLLLGKS